MQSLSSALNTAYGYAVQKPAWFIEVVLQGSTQWRSTYATVTWDSKSWTVDDIDLRDIRVGALEVSGSLVFGNGDNYWGGIALGEGFQDKRIRIWGYDGSMTSPAVGDPFLLCDAVGGRGSVSPTGGRVTVDLRDACAYKYGPRARINYAYGFRQLIPAGKIFYINGQKYVIERRNNG